MTEYRHTFADTVSSLCDSRSLLLADAIICFDYANSRDVLIIRVDVLSPNWTFATRVTLCVRSIGRVFHFYLFPKYYVYLLFTSYDDQRPAPGSGWYGDSQTGYDIYKLIYLLIYIVPVIATLFT